jgi:hypothetical protein
VRNWLLRLGIVREPRGREHSPLEAATKQRLVKANRLKKLESPVVICEV